MEYPIGTVLREEHEGGFSVWARVGRTKMNLNTRVLRVVPEWLCVYSTAPGDNGEWLAEAGDWPVIGAVPGTPSGGPVRVGGGAGVGDRGASCCCPPLRGVAAGVCGLAGGPLAVLVAQ